MNQFEQTRQRLIAEGKIKSDTSPVKNHRPSASPQVILARKRDSRKVLMAVAILERACAGRVH